MSTTAIEWTEQTWNPLVGCTIKSAGCAHCYAMRQAYRLEAMGQQRYQGAAKKVNGRIIWSGLVTPDEDALLIPLRRKKPTTWFVNSMSDLFWGDDEDLAQARALGVKNPEPVPFEFIDRVFAVMALCPQHQFQVLTKRPERMAEYLNHKYRTDGIESHMCAMLNDGLGIEPKPKVWPLPNVWMGTSIENQATADERIPHLLRVPAAVRFLSIEPLLGPVDLNKVKFPRSNGNALYIGDEGGIDFAWSPRQLLSWVIVGGESGPGARPFDIAWARDIIGQCKDAGVPCFVKQLGARPYSNADKISFLGADHAILMPERRTAPVFFRFLSDTKGGDPSEWPEDLRVREYPKARQA